MISERGADSSGSIGKPFRSPFQGLFYRDLDTQGIALVCYGDEPLTL